MTQRNRASRERMMEEIVIDLVRELSGEFGPRASIDTPVISKLVAAYNAVESEAERRVLPNMSGRKLVTYEDNQRQGLYGVNDVVRTGVRCACFSVDPAAKSCDGEYLTRTDAWQMKEQTTGRPMQFAWCDDPSCGSTVYLALPLPACQQTVSIPNDGVSPLLDAVARAQASDYRRKP